MSLFQINFSNINKNNNKERPFRAHYFFYWLNNLNLNEKNKQDNNLYFSPN